MDKSCMIIDEDGNVVEVGHPECVYKREDYWTSKGFRLEITDKEEALRRYREYIGKSDGSGNT